MMPTTDVIATHTPNNKDCSVIAFDSRTGTIALVLQVIQNLNRRKNMHNYAMRVPFCLQESRVPQISRSQRGGMPGNGHDSEKVQCHNPVDAILV